MVGEAAYPHLSTGVCVCGCVCVWVCVGGWVWVCGCVCGWVGGCVWGWVGVCGGGWVGPSELTYRTIPTFNHGATSRPLMGRRIDSSRWTH